MTSDNSASLNLHCIITAKIYSTKIIFVASLECGIRRRDQEDQRT